MKTIRNYVKAKSLEEAYELNQKKGSVLLGGMLWTRLGEGNIQTAIDLCDLGLNTIEEDAEQFVIGAMVSLRQIELHERLNTFFAGAPRDAVKDIIGVQFRNTATIGGSLWGRFGFSDVLTVFLALDTYVELYKGGIVPLEEFAAMKPDRDLLVRVIVKKTSVKVNYQAVRVQRTDFPVLTCAAALCEKDAAVVIGARPGRAVVCRDAEEILKTGVTEASARAFAEYAAEHIKVESNLRGSEEYRRHLVKVLVQRCLAAAAQTEG